MTKFNPYKTFAHDGKVLSQYKRIPDVECTGCHKMFNTTMELIDRETGKCEACQKASKEMTQKQADIRYRVEIKKNGIVVYTVRSSDDTRDYHVTVFEGKVSGCDCPSYKPCYHMRDVQAREDSRKPLEMSIKGTLSSNASERKMEVAPSGNKVWMR